jgi:uncharacterized delta-60 repeat protein
MMVRKRVSSAQSRRCHQGKYAAGLSRQLLSIIMVSIFISASLPNPAEAAAGDLDTNFGGDGKVTTDFFARPEAAFDVALQPDGRIVVAGAASPEDGSVDFALARYNNDGALDSNFGQNGRVTTDFSDVFDQANAVAIQADGKIVAAGTSTDQMTRGDFALARYNIDGSLDENFGTAGKVKTDFFGSFDSGLGMALQQDGRIIVAGATVVNSSNHDFAVARYNTDGTLDNTFGNGGKVTTDLFGFSDMANDVIVQQDGRILVAGSALRIASVGDFALVRYNADGTLDNSFGSGGWVVTDFFGFSDLARGLDLQTDGRIVVAGAANNLNVSGFDFALARYTTNGVLDPTFGSGGKVTTNFFANVEAASDLEIQSDGKIVAAGFTTPSGGARGGDFALARYKPDGQLDSEFGDGGRITTDFSGGSDVASALAIQSDNRIVVVGQASNPGTDNDFALARFASDPVPDFTLSLDRESLVVEHGDKTKVKVNVNRTGGFSGRVTVSSRGAEAINVVVKPDSITTDEDRVKFKLKIKGSAPTGIQQFVFVGEDDSGRSRTSTMTLDVR